jgi:hypothetical protein
MPGSSAHAGGHAGRVSAVAYGLLPWSIAIAWIAVLIVVVVAHCRPLIAARGRTRVWHCLHLAMAVTMALMYASGSLVVIGVSGVVWTTVFAASAALAAGMLVTEPRARSVGWLWPLVVVDLDCDDLHAPDRPPRLGDQLAARRLPRCTNDAVGDCERRPTGQARAHCAGIHRAATSLAGRWRPAGHQTTRGLPDAGIARRHAATRDDDDDGQHGLHADCDATLDLSARPALMASERAVSERRWRPTPSRCSR